MGAGGGGTILVLAPKENHQKIIQESNFLQIPIRIDFNGSKILYFKQDELQRA
jgi:galactokinase/mevalonate kinase-like predicted kinase